MSNHVLSLRVLTTSNAQARQQAIKSVIDASSALVNVNWKFVHAIPAAENGFAYDEVAALRTKGRTLSAAELSCYASHIAIIEDWLENQDSDVLFICEDDVYLDPWFDFQKAAQMMLGMDLSYLRLYSRVAMPFQQIAYRDRMQLIRFRWSPGGTQAFMLTEAGARRIVDRARKTNIITRPIDDFIDRYWEVGNPLYGLFPPAVLELNKPTGIHTKEQVAQREERQRIVTAERQTSVMDKLSAAVDSLSEKMTRNICERRLRARDHKLADLASSHIKGDFAPQSVPHAPG